MDIVHRCCARPDKRRVEDIEGSLLQFFDALPFFSLARLRVVRKVNLDNNEDNNESIIPPGLEDSL